MDIHTLQRDFRELANPVIAAHSQKFFKTGPGEYGEGDLFLGIRVPIIRKQVGKFRDSPMEDIVILLHSSYHEERLLALLILVHRFARGNDDEQTRIYNLYLAQTEYINNWDLVDSTAHHIVGAYLENRDRALLLSLARSDNLWERRIAIIATLHFIKKDDFHSTLNIATLLVHDSEDLIHKAVGWMLRECGKRELEAELSFLDRYHHSMPRTMLRYAIEHFPRKKREYYMGNNK